MNLLGLQYFGRLNSFNGLKNKFVCEPPVYANLVSSFEYIETCNRSILNYGWVEFPLAYTQVATGSVYLYFLAALFGRQYLIPSGEHRDNSTFPALSVSYSNDQPFSYHTPDFIVPFFTIIEFISYMGWIKVAETLLNPFGDDDEDFEINYLIDRNLQVSYMIVDEADGEMEMAEDPFLEAGISIPEELPYKDSRRNSIRSSLGKKFSTTFLPSSKISAGKDDMEVPNTGSLYRKRSPNIGQNMGPDTPYSPSAARSTNMAALIEETNSSRGSFSQDIFTINQEILTQNKNKERGDQGMKGKGNVCKQESWNTEAHSDFMDDTDEESLDSGSTQGEIIMNLSKLKQDLGKQRRNGIPCSPFKRGNNSTDF
ncbi:bestrophin homolog 24 isoform X2 [Eurytemora carolleeae]|uniref:bestrophin homolog 24 isoform X2 n=1 Tax=Eurytemora carolleeae TaxID=1294199 RepID=UPI000C78B2ED|nr:bestrophin homolog 24 isoform X2 [Eurytemora carolleeae]|eukprot:XP_023337532.1 bestrophin homolog 24-like isoform X2 [Eurytemora affinis]